jgi:hypothetical protein
MHPNMTKFLTLGTAFLLSWTASISQCTFESLFPLSWGAPKYSINEYYQGSPLYQTSRDTIRGSAFVHGLDYFFTARNLNLSFYSYQATQKHPCFKSVHVIVNCIASDSGLVAYNYQVTYPATEKVAYMAMIDSLRAMMEKKYTYSSMVKVPTTAIDATGKELSGEGVCYYFNNEPVVASNLTYPQFVVRAGYLAEKPKPSDGKTITNSAEEVAFYRLEILYKMAQPKW